MSTWKWTGPVQIGDSGQLLIQGSGSPEGVVTAPVGSIYQRSDGGTNSSVYIKESGSGNTGWTALGSGGGGGTVSVNGSLVSSPNFNDTTPSTPQVASTVEWGVSDSSVSGSVVPSFLVQSFVIDRNSQDITPGQALGIGPNGLVANYDASNSHCFAIALDAGTAGQTIRVQSFGVCPVQLKSSDTNPVLIGVEFVISQTGGDDDTFYTRVNESDYIAAGADSIIGVALTTPDPSTKLFTALLQIAFFRSVEFEVNGSNTGNQEIVNFVGINGSSISDDGFGNLTWSSGPVNVNPQSSTYQAVLSDANQLVTLTNASGVNFTIPKNATVAFPVGTTLSVIQAGAGQVTLNPQDGTVTINTPSSLTSRAQWSTVSVVQISANVWIAGGDLT